MSQFGSMDEEKKPLLPSAMKKKPPPPSWSPFLPGLQVFSLKAALFFACFYAGSAAYNLRDRQDGPPCHCHCQQEPEPEPAWAWLVRRYVLTGGDVVDVALALWRGLMWCSAPQAAAAALALALLAGGRSLAVRAAALVALAATAASHRMYLRMLGLLRIDRPRDPFLAIETAGLVAAAALDLLGFTAFVVVLGGDK